MDEEQEKRFWKFIMGDDLDFYEEYTIHLSDDEQEKFFDENPDFMCDYPISRDKMYLLRDVVYRGILRRIREYEGEKVMKRPAKILCLFLICSTTFTITGCFQKQESNPPILDEYPEGEYVVGQDIPEGEYVLFTNSDAEGYFSITNSKLDFEFDNHFIYNSIITISDNDNLHLDNCYAQIYSSDTELDIMGSGMFKVGDQISAGEYDVKINNNIDSGEFTIYTNSRGDFKTIGNVIDNKGQDTSNITLEDGQYIFLYNTHLIYDDIPQDTTNMSDEEIYDLAFEEYMNGNYFLASEYFSRVSSYSNSESYLKKCNLILDYQGVYDMYGANYIVIDNGTLYEYDTDHWGTYSVDKTQIEIAVLDLDGEFYFVDKFDQFDYENILELYKPAKSEDGTLCIEQIYVGQNFSALYEKNNEPTHDYLEELYQTEISKLSPSIGMTADEVRESTWGEPIKINKTTTEYGVDEQWVYDDYKYIYLEDGIVTAIQE